MISVHFPANLLSSDSEPQADNPLRFKPRDVRVRIRHLQQRYYNSFYGNITVKVVANQDTGLLLMIFLGWQTSGTQNICFVPMPRKRGNICC